MTTHIDPVCGMTVDDQKSAEQSTYEGATYRFCSAGCKTKFDAHPTQYASKQAAV